MGSQSHYHGSITATTVLQDQEKQTTTVRPSALDIVWGKDSRYWRLPTKDEAPAELLQVSWVEVSGSLDLSMFEEKKNYRLFFRVSLQSDAFGWQGSPVYMMVKVGQGRQKWKKFDLGTAQQNTIIEIPADLKFEVPVKDKQGPGDKLRFGLYEIWRGRWKGGLVIHDVRITREEQTMPE
ncbi:hypothetical protein AAC387_Pa05g3407 [Persea americana]